MARATAPAMPIPSPVESAQPRDSYPRDMIGYGRDRPDPQWPGGARVAVQFVVNYEEGGENNVLHGDAASEAFLSEIVGAAPWEGERHPNMESIYEYGSRAGFWRLHRLFTERDVRPTVFAVATAMKRNTAAIDAMVEARWEVASHGLKWIEHRDLPREEEGAQMREAVLIHEGLTGEPPAGWYQGRTSVNTLELTAEIGRDLWGERGFLWSADSYADDLPYWAKTAAGAQLIVPYTLDANDMRFATPQGFNSGAQFESYLRDTLDTLLEEADAGYPAMMSVGLHCRLVGRPGRAAALRRFLDHCIATPGVWIATRGEIAEHWRARFPHGAAA